MKSELSNDFAMKIIDKELELEANCNIHSLREVVLLYREAIEYFDEHRDPKFWDFQERLQRILMRPNILKLMNDENQRYLRNHRNNWIPVKTTHTHSVGALITHHRSRDEIDETVAPLDLPEDSLRNGGKIPKNALRIVETQQNRAKNVSNKALTDLKSQESDLEERLSYRKQKLLSISSDACYTSFMSKNLNLSYKQYSRSPTLQNFSDKNRDDAPFFL